MTQFPFCCSWAWPQAALTFLAVSNRTYTVEWTPQLAGRTWNRLLDVFAQPIDRTESVTDTNAGGPMGFSRSHTTPAIGEQTLEVVSPFGAGAGCELAPVLIFVAADWSSR